MPEKKKTIFNENFYSWLLVIVFALTFVTAIMLSLTLPFVNVTDVASADSIIPSSLPHLRDLDSGTSVYGLKVDIDNFINFVHNSFGSLGNANINVSFTDSDFASSLSLNLTDGVYFDLLFDYQSFSESRSVILSYDGSDYFGLGYLLFDSPFVYTVPTDSNALTLCDGVFAITTPLSVGWSPEAFATRFVTPTDSPSNTVFFNLDTLPKSPKLADFKTFSSGSTSWYYYDYFQEYGTGGSIISANDVQTVGWHVSVHKEVSPPNTTILGYNVSLRIGRTDIYSYYVSGANYDTGVISEQKWLVASNYTFGDMKLYKYDFSGSTSYYILLPHEDGKVRPVDLQFGADGWNSWLALFDLSNFVSMSNDVYINLGYQNAKFYYDELIKTKSQEAFLQGKNQGYELGLQDGKLQGGNYTFTSLLGAVFDAPIEAFRGLFNFEILGTNMQGFVLALLTLSVIIIVIKVALGGK